MKLWYYKNPVLWRIYSTYVLILFFYLFYLATCLTYGSSYYVTFDGKAYTFRGKCKYQLVSETNDEFSVMVDTTANCVKSAQVSYKNATIDLIANLPKKQTVTITYNDGSKNQRKNLKMPVYDNKLGFIFRKVSSHLVEFVADGILVEWDGRSSLSVHLDRRFSNKVGGLCGNYNFNTEDEFGIEDSAISFGNKWKIGRCPDVPTKVTLLPCELFAQNKVYAETQCSRLLRSPFNACHNYVNPTRFLDQCKQDVCTRAGNSVCLCNMLLTYARLCAAKGVRLKWRARQICSKFI